MPGRMAGKVALITGGGGGIGEATGRLFVEEGAVVVLVDQEGAAAESAAAGIRRATPGASVTAVAADVTRPGEAERMVAEAVARHGALHSLVNVAGVRVYSSLAEASAEDWQFIIGVNVLGTAYACQAALAPLRAGGSGTIVNVSSVYGVMGREGMGQYDTTKAAVLGLTRALAVEEARHGIRVNAVCPGSTITSFHIRRASERGVSERELRETGARNNLLQRWAEPREIAYPILFLSSSESSYMTGVSLMVDAGKSIT